jgi:multiple sugar transport system substrate-binding protein
MPQELEFSIMAPSATEESAAGIQPLLDQFEAETRIHVKIRLLAWDSAWSTLVRSALYSDGPDVSEIGTTWLGDLVGMNALRPFNTAEVAALGKASAFVPALRETAAQHDDSHFWAIPWMSGARLLFYRPALLERVGLDPQTAFSTSEKLEDTICQLRDAGVRTPWTIPTGTTHTTLHNISSWVWASGGSFISPDRRYTDFMRPEALKGMAAYFRLGSYLSPEVRSLNGLEPDDWFLLHSDTALTMSGPWLFCEARKRFGERVNHEIAVALPPGPPFVGGSHLVIWKYSRNAENAMRLIRFLTSAQAQMPYCQRVGLLPARLDNLALEPFASDPMWQTASKGLTEGRAFPGIRLWGLVEDRLTTGFGMVWQEWLDHPAEGIEAILRKTLGPIANRLDTLLKQG